MRPQIHRNTMSGAIQEQCWAPSNTTNQPHRTERDKRHEGGQWKLAHPRRRRGQNLRYDRQGISERAQQEVTSLWQQLCGVIRTVSTTGTKTRASTGRGKVAEVNTRCCDKAQSRTYRTCLMRYRAAWKYIRVFSPSYVTAGSGAPHEWLEGQRQSPAPARTVSLHARSARTHRQCSP